MDHVRRGAVVLETTKNTPLPASTSSAFFHRVATAGDYQFPICHPILGGTKRCSTAPTVALWARMMTPLNTTPTINDCVNWVLLPPTTSFPPARQGKRRKKCVLEGNQIIDIGSLSTFLTAKTACRPCATRCAVQLAFDFAGVLDAEKGMATRQRKGPSYCDRLRLYLRRRGGHAASANIPSFTTVGEANKGFASTIHF